MACIPSEVCNERGVNVASDHHLLINNIRLNITSIKRNRNKAQRKFDISISKEILYLKQQRNKSAIGTCVKNKIFKQLFDNED